MPLWGVVGSKGRLSAQTVCVTLWAVEGGGVASHTTASRLEADRGVD